MPMVRLAGTGPDNPYMPIWSPIDPLGEQQNVLMPELSRQARRSRQWEKGRADRLAGKPCVSNDGAYLEGWYNQL